MKILYLLIRIIFTTIFSQIKFISIFLIRDDYQQPMINIPHISISTEKNLFLSKF